MRPHITLLLTLTLAAASGARAEVTWLPQTYDFHPRSRADWQEPRMGLTWHEETLDAALGGPMVLAAGPGWGATLEGVAILGLGRDGSFFPLETVDGIMQLGVEARRGPWLGKVRIGHWSAHKADGDTSVAYREKTFSREWVSLEAGRVLGPGFAYARLARPWHAVPKSPGWKLGVGWTLDPEPQGGFYAAGHWSVDEDQEYRLSHSVIGGWAFGGQNRLILGARYHRGFSPRGQYLDRRTSFWGLELQIRPRARSLSDGTP